MRVRIELLLSAVAMVAIVCSIAYALPGAQYKCGGTYNCKTANCYDAGAEGYSCGLLATVDHMVCEFTGKTTDSCTTVTKPCAKVNFYVGGDCDNNKAPYCPGTFANKSKFLSEDGCDARGP